MCVCILLSVHSPGRHWDSTEDWVEWNFHVQYIHYILHTCVCIFSICTYVHTYVCAVNSKIQFVFTAHTVKPPFCDLCCRSTRTELWTRCTAMSGHSSKNWPNHRPPWFRWERFSVPTPISIPIHICFKSLPVPSDKNVYIVDNLSECPMIILRLFTHNFVSQQLIIPKDLHMYMYSSFLNDIIAIFYMKISDIVRFLYWLHRTILVRLPSSRTMLISTHREVFS